MDISTIRAFHDAIDNYTFSGFCAIYYALSYIYSFLWIFLVRVVTTSVIGERVKLTAVELVIGILLFPFFITIGLIAILLNKYQMRDL